MSLRAVLASVVAFALDPWGAQRAWRARRDVIVSQHQRPTYDAYPESRNHPRVRIALMSGNLMETVDLDGYSLHELNFAKKQWRRDWLVDQILAAELRLLERVEEARKERLMKGQGLAEYALILALVAVVAVVALILLGGTIAQYLTSIANQISGASPPP